MPIDVEVDRIKGVAWVRVSGALEIREAFERSSEFLDHPEFVPGMPTIWDLTKADMSAYEATDMRLSVALNRDLAERRGRARMAIVAPDDLSFGLAQMHRVLGESPHLEVSVFRDLSAAEEWVLGGGSSSGEESATSQETP